MKRLNTRLIILFSGIGLLATLISLFIYMLSNALFMEAYLNNYGITLLQFHKSTILIQFITTISLLIIGGVVILSFIKQLKSNHTLQIQELVDKHSAAIQAMNEKEQFLKEAAITDELTGIANRRKLNDQLQHEWEKASKYRQHLSLAILDIDLFKDINDNYGHLVGDDRLKKIAHAIYQSIQNPKEFVARYGGDEFIIVLPNTNIREATYIAEKIRHKIEKLEILLDDQTDRYVTVSIGVTSVVPSDKKSIEDVIHLADEALYEAKLRGRNKVVAKLLG